LSRTGRRPAGSVSSVQKLAVHGCTLNSLFPLPLW
jgi:hypothetical protein